MKTRPRLFKKTNFHAAFLFFFIFVLQKIQAQDFPGRENVSARYVAGNNTDIFGTSGCFIENIGQYGKVYSRYPDMGKIVYAYEGFSMPVLFTTKGVIYLHRKIVKQPIEFNPYIF